MLKRRGLAREMEKAIRKIIEQCGRRLDALLRKGAREERLEDLIHAFYRALDERLDDKSAGSVPGEWKLSVRPDRYPPAARDRLAQWVGQIAASGQQYVLDHRRLVRGPITVALEENPDLEADYVFTRVAPQRGLIIEGLLMNFSEGMRPPIRLEKALARHRATLGRSPDAEIIVDDPTVSGFHATLSCDEEGHLFLSDCGSANGTFVNGRAVSERWELRLGDEVMLGSVKLRLAYEGFDASGTASPSPLHTSPPGS